MNNILMYCHNGSGNHGCEAIIRSTVGILNRADAMQCYQISRSISEDRRYGVDRLVNLLPEYAEVPHQGKEFLRAYAAQKLLHDTSRMDHLSSKTSFCVPQGPTVSMSIGGDNYCYKGYKLYCGYHQISRSLGHKTVLWGCSVEPGFLEYEDLLADLRTFDKIVVRESISYEAMYKKGLRNLALYPDPAFTLQADPQAEVYPPENTVGINLSPMVISYEGENSQVLENYKELVRYILDETEMNVALIPHVVWDISDDRTVLRKLKSFFAQEDRVQLLEDMNATALKAYISRLRFLVAARTHASVAAYSTGVPTLVAGYSVKSRGIARDIFGTEENYVVSVKEMTDVHELTGAFCWIMDHEQEIRDHLAAFMPGYIDRAYAAGQEIAAFFEEEKLKTGISRDNCVGCGACVNVCPRHCLRMEEDEEGFLYPVAEESACIHCGLCAKVCPSRQEPGVQVPLQALAVKNREEAVRGESSSGGVFSALAEKVLAEKGVVFGAALNDWFSVEHIAAEDAAQLAKLRGAKYSQSDPGTVYRQVKEQLEGGRKVLFSGTPCQVSALRTYLGRDYEGLVCVDMICHGVPSPKAWREYLRESTGGREVAKLSFRAKDTGWSRYSYAMKMEFADGSVLLEPNGENRYLTGVVQDYFLRPSCSACHCKGYAHPGDITLGDYWGIWNQMPDFDDNKGISLVLIHSKAGRELMDRCAGQLISKETRLQDAVAENPSWLRCAQYKRERGVFFETLRRSGSFGRAVDAAQEAGRSKPSLLDKIAGIKARVMRRKA